MAKPLASAQVDRTLAGGQELHAEARLLRGDLRDLQLDASAHDQEQREGRRPLPSEEGREGLVLRRRDT